MLLIVNVLTAVSARALGLSKTNPPTSGRHFQEAAPDGAYEEPLGTGRLPTCERLTAEAFDALRAFRHEHRGQGPEPIP